MVHTGFLHHIIIKHIIDKGIAPDIGALSFILNEKADVLKTALYDLQEQHGVVLHPMEPKIWVIHPFSLSPTNFFVRSANGMWWGNCAWCSLGIAALLNEDVTITTNFGAHDEQAVVHITKGAVQEKNLYVHFPIPMKKAWNNIIYTCSHMLLFQNEDEIDRWSKSHNIPKGDVQPITNIWEFSKIWYGNHLNPKWKKWTMEEAKDIFQQFNLTHTIWNLETSGSRF